MHHMHLGVVLLCEGLPQEKVLRGYVRISPSLSCHYEFPSIMSPFYAAVQWKIPETQGTNAIVCPWLCSKRELLSLWWPDAVFCLSFWSIWSLFQSTFRTAYSCEINRPMQLLSSHEEGGQRCLNVGGKKIKVPPDRCGKLWPFSSCAQQEKTQSHFFSLLAQGFSSVLLRNCNIAGGDQLSYTPPPCLWDIAGPLCNKGRKWKHTKSNFYVIWTSRRCVVEE